MPRFIVLPKRSPASELIRFNLSDITPEVRTTRSATLRDSNAEPFHELREWIGDHGKEKATLKSPADRPPTTGGAVIDLASDQAARKLERDLKDYSVIPDEPLPLIAPRRVTATRKEKLTAANRWHLKAVGLRGKGRRHFGKGIEIAVFDTGIDPNHPEIEGKVSDAFRYLPATANVERAVPSADNDGHGTHVAGLICGASVGIAPGAKVVGVEMLPGGKGSLSNFIICLNWLVENQDLDRVRILNMSAGLPGYRPELQVVMDNVLALGILPIIATGNEGRDKTRSPGNYKEVVSVGAMNANGKVSAFSSGGRIVHDNQMHIVPDLVAPGERVYSCVRGGGYEAWDGTSLATPIVSGIAALILQKYPTLMVLEVVDELLSTCKDLGFPPERQGHGLIQVPGL